MRHQKKLIIVLLLLLAESIFCQPDTSYISSAPESVRRLIQRGKAPTFTLQLYSNYNIGVFDLAANDNTHFSKQDYIDGRNFGTRHGFGFGLTGKIALHKEGNMRLVAGGSYNKFLSNFVIGEDPEGKVHYDAISFIIGFEDSFTPDKKVKPYIGIDILGSIINGEAQFTTDTTNFVAKVKSAFRIGFSMNLGFEYAINNQFGLNLGAKFSHLNILLKKNKVQTSDNEIPFNDEAVTTKAPYSGWKQFAFMSFHGGVNFYFGMRDKK